MKIGFFTVFKKDPKHYVMAKGLVDSVHKTMPGVPIIQFTDESSPPVLGVDEVVRKSGGKLLELRLQHYAECEGEWLLVDTDVLVKKDVRHVFDDSFDVALSDRNCWHAFQSDKLVEQMPYNTGVVFVRNPSFWKNVLRIWKKLGQNDWLSEQRAVARALEIHPYSVKLLPMMLYNYPPISEHDSCEEAFIVHYKGDLKAWYWNLLMRIDFLRSERERLFDNIPLRIPS